MFFNQFSIICKQLTRADFSVSTGLFDASFWYYNCYYWVNVERSNVTENKINISFTNNNNVPIDVLVVTFKANELIIDVEISIVSIP
jgi:hypothetical protein